MFQASEIDRKMWCQQIARHWFARQWCHSMSHESSNPPSFKPDNEGNGYTVTNTDVSVLGGWWQNPEEATRSDHLCCIQMTPRDFRAALLRQHSVVLENEQNQVEFSWAEQVLVETWHSETTNWVRGQESKLLASSSQVGCPWAVQDVSCQWGLYLSAPLSAYRISQMGAHWSGEINCITAWLPLYWNVLPPSSVPSPSVTPESKHTHTHTHHH